MLFDFLVLFVIIIIEIQMAADRRLAQEFSYCLRNNRFIGREGGYFCLLELLQPIIYPLAHKTNLPALLYGEVLVFKRGYLIMISIITSLVFSMPFFARVPTLARVSSMSSPIMPSPP